MSVFGSRAMAGRMPIGDGLVVVRAVLLHQLLQDIQRDRGFVLLILTVVGMQQIANWWLNRPCCMRTYSLLDYADDGIALLCLYLQPATLSPALHVQQPLNTLTYR